MKVTGYFVQRKKNEEDKKPEKPEETVARKTIGMLLEAQMILGELEAKKREKERKERPEDPVWLTAWYTLWGVLVFLGLGYLAYKVITEIFF